VHCSGFSGHHQRAAFTITIQQSKYQARSTAAARYAHST
jgi:hypothetical protein